MCILQKSKKTGLYQNAAEVPTDDGNNNDSSALKTMNQGGLSKEINDKKYISGVAVTQQNNSATLLPSVSPSYVPMSSSKSDLMHVAVSTYISHC